MTTAAHLEFRKITKAFPGVLALADVSFGVASGSIHALVGENGAGKSTLLKILGGALRPSSGELAVDGRKQAFRSTTDALAAGIAVIHQELNLVPEMTVAENLFLGHWPGRLGIINRRKLHELTLRLLERVGEEINPAARVSRLPIAQRQMVEIAKSLSRNARIFAFDEPTSSLSAPEVQQLFAIIRELKRQGCVILYVSHRLDEIFELCDGLTVLRDGHLVESRHEMAGITREGLVRLMVGREVREIPGGEPRPRGGPALQARGLFGPGLSEPATLGVARGEILGIFGLVGAGRTELLRLLCGASKKRSGEILMEGRPVEIRSPAQAIRAGIMLCPEDRKKEGIIAVRSVTENINLSARRHWMRLGFIMSERREREHARRLVERLGIKTPGLRQAIVNLSGGNQQKVILARWLAQTIKVLLLDEPTRGIDVGAKSELYRIIDSLARKGAGVILVSSELPEILGLADRILVMRQGAIVAEMARDEATPERVMRAALPLAGDAARPLATATP